MRTAGLLILGAVTLAGCGGGSASAANPAARPAAVPVRFGEVARQTLAEYVRGPGRTDAVRQVRVSAPFAGTLTSLRVADGDRVTAGEVIGSLVSRDAAAALTGAQAMLAAARTPAESTDARRALALAQGGLVRAPLRAPEAGVVVSHGATEGDLVSEGDSIVTIAVGGSVVFVAQVAQSDLARVRPGQPAMLDLAAQPEPAHGVVHAILVSASSENLSAPVRIDFAPGKAPPGVGLFGTARIKVAERRSALVVPAAAVLRDDIYGTARVAVVEADSTAHWVTVTTGITDGDLIEIVAPALPARQRVIVSGQVGLPDSTRVEAQR